MATEDFIVFFVVFVSVGHCLSPITDPIAKLINAYIMLESGESKFRLIPLEACKTAFIVWLKVARQ